MALFTPETASEMGQRSGAARRETPFVYVPPLRTVIKPNGTDKPPKDPVQTAIKRQLELVAEQIAHTRKVLNDDNTEFCPACERCGIAPHHRAQLLKALDALLDRQRKLLQIPDPGSRRPGREVTRRNAPPADPTPAEPGPATPQAT